MSDICGNIGALAGVGLPVIRTLNFCFCLFRSRQFQECNYVSSGHGLSLAMLMKGMRLCGYGSSDGAGTSRLSLVT